MTLQHLIRRHAFTEGLSEEQIARLAAISAEVAFEPGTPILQNGQLSQYLYLLLSGSVAVELRTPQITVCVQALGAGEVFGWSALIEDRDTFCQLRARERVFALRLDGVLLAHLLHTDAELGSKLLFRTLGLMASRVKATEERFAEMCGVRLHSAAD